MEPILIKRYSNRKLYDTSASQYVTIEQIGTMIRNHQEIRVIDNASKEDLTAITLAQVILEEEKKASSTPLQVLKDVIRSSNHRINEFVGKRVTDRVSHLVEEVEKRVEHFIKQAPLSIRKELSSDRVIHEDHSGASDHDEHAQLLKRISILEKRITELEHTHGSKS